MAKSPLPVAILVVFVAGGAVGGAAAALVMRAQVGQPNGRDQQPTGQEQERTTRASTESLTALISGGETPRPIASSDAHMGRTTTSPALSDDDDPGTGTWLADSLTQLEQKYQAMMRQDKDAALATRASASPTAEVTPAMDQTAAISQTAALDPHRSEAHELDRSTDTTPAEPPPAPVVEATEPAQTYIAQANVTHNNTSTTHVTQVNQTVLMGYVPLLVPVPTNAGQANPGAVQAVSPTTTAPWVGLSPWAPIDMSRHNNPWKSSRFP